jgi:hypothetical protein
MPYYRNGLQNYTTGELNKDKSLLPLSKNEGNMKLTGLT